MGLLTPELEEVAEANYEAGTAAPPEYSDVRGKVRELQALLSAHGYCVEADGFFGPATANALRRFQARHDNSGTEPTPRDAWSSEEHDSPGLHPRLPSPRDISWEEHLRNERAFAENLDEMLKTHRDEFAAIHAGRIVGFAPDRDAIDELALRELGEGVQVLIVQVTPERS